MRKQKYHIAMVFDGQKERCVLSAWIIFGPAFSELVKRDVGEGKRSSASRNCRNTADVAVLLLWGSFTTMKTKDLI